MKDPIKLLVVAGARPNFMKIAPMVRAIENSQSFDYKIVHTGQHYDEGMSDVFFQELEIPPPDFHLDVGSGSHADQTAKVISRFEPVCIEEKPDCVVVVGDVNSTAACALVAKKLNISVAHIEAGLRSGDRTMPEEINRLVTDAISDFLFATEESAVENLKREGHPEDRIHFVGHVMIDNLFHELKKIEDSLPGPDAEHPFAGQRYGVVTLHRPSNVDNKQTLSSIAGSLNEISGTLPLVFPVHPRTAAKLSEFGIRLEETIHLTDPLGYRNFLRLWKDAAIVLTDSGGLQEETTALGIPCLTLRENTERPVTLEMGTNQLVGTDRSVITREAYRVLNDKSTSKRVPPLWDGQASERILDALHGAIMA